MEIRAILTGATGMVGEGVLFECLDHPGVKDVLMVNRRHYDATHPKLKELIVPDFLQLEQVRAELTGYNACFFCAGVSSVGMNEADYTHLTYDITLHFAQTLVGLNPDMVFDYVSGSLTDSTEKGRMMWARVKGRTENALMRLPFKREYNFRPGFMKPTPGQKSIRRLYKILGLLFPVFKVFFPKRVLTMHQVGLAMINSVVIGYPKQILEIKDIKELASLRL
jgi:hypothetical protein